MKNKTIISILVILFSKSIFSQLKKDSIFLNSKKNEIGIDLISTIDFLGRSVRYPNHAFKHSIQYKRQINNNLYFRFSASSYF